MLNSKRKWIRESYVAGKFYPHNREALTEILQGFLPIEKQVKAKGEVVWQNKISATSFETGILISHMDDADKKYFMQFIFDQMAKVVGFK